MTNKINFIKTLPKTIYFNFKYLPLKQAIKLPIWLFNVRLEKLKGTVIIDSKKTYSGMIRLGCISNTLYDCNHKLVWENRGEVVFNGSCIIGHGSGISTGKNGLIIFGNNFLATTTVKIISYISIVFGENVRVAWESIIMDTDFHETIDISTNERSNPKSPIKIGDNNWIGIRTSILKGTITPDFTIIGACSVLNKQYNTPEYSIIAGKPPKVAKNNVKRDLSSYVE